MLKYLKYYPSIFEERVNHFIMDKEGDKPLVEYVIEAWKSLQIIEGIKFLGYEYTEDMSEIELNKYIIKRQGKGTRKKDRVDYKYVDDDKVGLLTVHLELTSHEQDFSKGTIVEKKKRIKKNMLIPLQDEDGNYFIKGRSYHLLQN